MRLIAGSAGSVPLEVPRDLARPTTDRVREALFGALGDLVPGARVLDLFAGSGSLGLEALSRGAVSADFVDSSGAASEVIARNLGKTRLAGGRIHRREVLAFLRGVGESCYDLVFADPPYARGEGERELLAALLLSPGLASSIAPGGLLILESLATAPLPETPLWLTKDTRTYGKTRVSFLATREP
jgi:16S rRNA (guanine966-N2)-methyltransferase